MPLYRRFERAFQAKSDQREAEVQSRLREIHESLSPVQDWRKHGRWYENQREQTLQERRAVRLKEAQDIAQANLRRNYFHSPIARILAAEEQAQARLQSSKLSHIRELRLKQKHYACIAQVLHKPISVSRDGSPLGLPKKLTPHRPAHRSPAQSEEPQHSRFVGWRRPHSKRHEVEVSRSVELKQQFRVKEKSVRKSDSEVLTRSVDRPKDYLTEQRKTGGKALRSHIGTFEYRPGLFLDDQTSDVHRLQKAAVKLGQKAAHHDNLLRHLDDDLDSQIEACGSVSAMYLDSIRAKLKVISSFSAMG